MAKKYKLLKRDKIKYSGHTLYRIQALRDFSDVRAGDLGGYIENEYNLSHYDNCWVYDDSKVMYEATVWGKAKICERSVARDHVTVGGSAIVCNGTMVNGMTDIEGDAYVASKEDYIVFKNHWSSSRYFTWTRSNNMWKVGCFYGTGEELIKKAYKDSQLSGDMYKKYVEFVEDLMKVEGKNDNE